MMFLAPFAVLGFWTSWCSSPGRSRLLVQQATTGGDCNSGVASLDHDSNRVRRKTTLESGHELEIISRTVPLAENWSVKVWEMFQPATEIEEYWQRLNVIALSDTPDPFGLVTWPGSVIAAQEMLRFQDSIKDSTVIVLGAGPGVEAQAIASLGAARVIATDIHPTSLHLLSYGAQEAGLSQVIETKSFDLFSADRLPRCDILVAADVLYNGQLGQQLGLRCQEVLAWEKPPKILVSDSQQFPGTDFVPALNKKLGTDFDWEQREIDAFTGSGVLLDEDQTYPVNARVLCIGWDI